MKPPVGRCYWAVAPYSPRPPFRLYAGEGNVPREVASPAQLTAAARKGMSEFTMLTPVKARPVLVITDVLQPHDEVLALRLQRLEKLTSKEAERVRQHEDETLYHLSPEQFQGLPVENAAILTALLRLPIDAVDTAAELGALNENELRVVHERVVRTHGLNLEMLVIDKARELLERLRSR